MNQFHWQPYIPIYALAHGLFFPSTYVSLPIILVQVHLGFIFQRNYFRVGLLFLFSFIIILILPSHSWMLPVDCTFYINLGVSWLDSLTIMWLPDTHTHNVVYFDSIPPSQSVCNEFSQEHQMWFISLLKIAPNIYPIYFYLSFYIVQNKLSLIFLKWYGCETGTKQDRDKGKNLTHPHRWRLPWSFEFRDCTPTDIRAELCMTLNQFRSDLLQINTSIKRVRATDTINSLNCLQPTHTLSIQSIVRVYMINIHRRILLFSRWKLFFFSGCKYRWWRSSGLCWALGGVEPWFYKCHTLCLPITYFSV